MNSIKRKPDFETESFRAWIPTEKEKKAIEENSKNDLKVDLGDGKSISLCGFNVASKNGIPQFAYKFRHDKRMILYYIVEDNEKTRGLLEGLKTAGKMADYEVIDQKEQFKNMTDSYKHLTAIYEKKQKRAKKNRHNSVIVRDNKPGNDIIPPQKEGF